MHSFHSFYHLKVKKAEIDDFPWGKKKRVLVFRVLGLSFPDTHYLLLNSSRVCFADLVGGTSGDLPLLNLSLRFLRTTEGVLLLS